MFLDGNDRLPTWLGPSHETTVALPRVVLKPIDCFSDRDITKTLLTMVWMAPVLKVVKAAFTCKNSIRALLSLTRSY